MAASLLLSTSTVLAMENEEFHNVRMTFPSSKNENFPNECLTGSKSSKDENLHEARMTVSNISDNLIYNVTLECEAGKKNLRIMPNERK